MKKRRSYGESASLAETILDREGRPAALLDRGARVRAANLALASLLGWARTDLQGKAWTELCLAPGDDDQKRVRRLFDEIGQRGARGIEMPCRTRSGERLTLVVDVQPVGSGGRAGLLLTAQEVRPSPGAGVTAGGGFQYEVSCREGEFGILKRVIAFGDAGARTSTRRHCYEALYARDSPCPGCPAPRLEAGTVRALTSVVRRSNPKVRFDVTSARVSGGEDALVTAWPIDEEMLRQLIAAKVDELAGSSALSERERAVLDLLLLGRSREEIAAALRISVSTVKYHQRNLERKMGADSRVDLFRLVLF